MNYIEEAEKELKHYRLLKSSIKTLEKKIEHLQLRQGPGELKAMQYEESGVKASKKDNSLENLLYEVGMLQECMRVTRIEMDRIDEALESTRKTDPHKRHDDLLRLWYIEKWDRDAIANELAIDGNTHIYRRLDEAKYLFSISLFGLKAIK